MALIVAESVMAFDLLKYIGAAYLVYLGFRILRNKEQSLETISIPSQSSRRAKYAS